MEVNSTGIVTPGCGDCEKLKKRMIRLFSERGVSINFLETDYTLDPERATEMAIEFGFDDIPAFEVAGIAFVKGFDEVIIDEVMNAIRN